MGTRRVPGKAAKKFQFLKRISAKEFPYLIGDILYFVFGHTNVKILDGPGDGKRDILSIDSDGNKQLTQCKYLSNVKKAIGSRESDEIVIALKKFGCSYGSLVTTGKLSPQAKREYSDNYPDLNLSYQEGVNVVDNVLSSPILTKVWVKNNDIARSSYQIFLPFILRRLSDDNVISIDLSDWHKKFGKRFSIFESQIPTLFFHPYRRSINPSFRESTHHIFCYNILCNELHYLNEIEDMQKELFQIISKLTSREDAVIRFGSAYAALVVNDNIVDKTMLKEEAPKAMVTSSGKLMSEKEWVIPISDPSWLFPNRLHVLESLWAAWYNKQLDCCLSVQLDYPFEFKDSPLDSILYAFKMDKVRESIFLGLTSRQFKQLKDALSVGEEPNWKCDTELNVTLFGWVHPIFDENNRYSINFGKQKISFENKQLEHSFEKIKAKLYTIIDERKYKKIDPLAAVHYSRAAKKPLIPENEFMSFDSAHLFHYFEDIPSPVYLNQRKMCFSKMWEVGPETKMTELIVTKTRKQILSDEKQEGFDIKRGHRTKNYFAKYDLTYNVPVEFSACEFIESIVAELALKFNEVEKKIGSVFNKVQTSTEFFWNEEVGIQFAKQDEIEY